MVTPAHLNQNKLPYLDLNNTAREKIRNPQNFDYNMAFDRLPDQMTLKSPHYSFFPHKATPRSLSSKKERNLKAEEKTYYNNLFRAETAAALHHEMEKKFSGERISKKEKKKFMKKLEKNFKSKGRIIKFITNEFKLKKGGKKQRVQGNLGIYDCGEGFILWGREVAGDRKIGKICL